MVTSGGTPESQRVAESERYWGTVETLPPTDQLCVSHRCPGLCHLVWDMSVWTLVPPSNRQTECWSCPGRVCPRPLLLYRPHFFHRVNCACWWVCQAAAAVDTEIPGPHSRPAWALWWGSKNLEVGGGRGGEGKGIVTSVSRQKVNCASSQCQPVLGP